MPQPLYSQEKSPLYTLNRKFGGPQNCSGHFEGEKSAVGMAVFIIISRKVAQE